MKYGNGFLHQNLLSDFNFDPRPSIPITQKTEDQVHRLSKRRSSLQKLV